MTLSLSYARPFAALVLVLFLSGAGSIVAQESFRATHVAQLAADEETQAVDDDSANGIGIFRVDRAAGTLEYRVSVAGLTGIIGAHIHRGAFGEDGPVVVPLAITDAMHTASGIATGLSAGFLDSLLAGQAYVNVHTSEHQPGHIRGQIIELPNALVPVMTTVGEPHDVTGDSGIGAVAMFIDEATRTMRYSLEWERLTGPATSAHFHLAAPGQAGPPVHPIALPGDPSVMNTSGVWQMSPEHLDALKNGLIYVNIHTAVNPMGEIRGQVLPADLYTAAVNAANEVPDRSDSSNGIGTATAIVLRSPIGGVVFVSSIVDHTTGPVTMAHIHRGAIGVSGGVVVPLSNDGLTTSNWDVQSAPVTTEDIATFMATGMYVNYHTDRFQPGEIRGQLIPAQGNLSTTPSAVPMPQVGSASMAAWHDGANGSIGLALPDDVALRGTVELFSAIGERVAAAPVTSGTVRISSADLATGAYFARLVVDGRVIATARVAVR